MKIRKVPVAALALAALWGCAGNGPTSTFEELGQDANTVGFGRLYPQDPNESAFVFGVGDTVLVGVAEDPDLAATQIIRQDGMITLPMINDLEAAGLTTEGLRKKIELRLAAFMSDPHVTVTVGLVQSKFIFVAGQDPRTGGSMIKKLPYKGDTTLLDVFVDMGAPSTLLDDDCHVKVIRGDPRHPRVMTINVKEIYALGYTGGNIQVRPDDIIYVPPTWLGRVNAVIAGVSMPFQSLFTITRSVVEVDHTIRILQGDDGGYGYGGGYYP